MLPRFSTVEEPVTGVVGNEPMNGLIEDRRVFWIGAQMLEGGISIYRSYCQR